MQAAQGKQGVCDAIDRIRQSEEILNQTLDAEAKAHQTAARSAITARDEIQRTLTETTRQIDDITAKLKEYEQLLKEGKTLPVDADVSKAKEALDKLKTYADQNAQFELKVATEKAQAAITNVEGMIKALDRIQTESQHQVASNVGAVRAESRVVAVSICHCHSR